ncbi:hypothetical protein F4818DRAFT_428570 [Hypoxylon cercidicola]|nr:hypothetical protein F4818DRAFT_428570 [Hypoxylon cercidicola]
MDSLYFDTFDDLPDLDSPPPVAETNDSFCSEEDDVPCIKCRKRKDGKLCRKCYLRIHGDSEKPSKSPLELVSTAQRADKPDSKDVTGHALDTFGLSKLTLSRQSSSDNLPAEDEKPREANCWVTSALGQWVQHDHSPPQTPRRTSSTDRTCHCSPSRPCAGCENTPRRSSERRVREECHLVTGSRTDIVSVKEKVLYESTTWDFDNGYTHSHTHTHTRTRTDSESTTETHHSEESLDSGRVELLRLEVRRRKPRYMAEIWSYSSGRRLSRWDVEFYVMPLCGTLTRPYDRRLCLGPGTPNVDDYASRLWSIFTAWVARKYMQLVASTRRILGLRDTRFHGPEELD